MLLLVITFYFGLLHVIAFQSKVKLRVLNLGRGTHNRKASSVRPFMSGRFMEVAVNSSLRRRRNLRLRLV